MKILYIFSGERRTRMSGEIHKDFPDTQLYGLNHLHKFGIEAEYKEIDDLIKNKWLAKILPFRIKHLLTFFLVKRGNYDVVFGSSLLYPLFFKKIFRVKTKFVILNTSVNRIISANKNKKIKLAAIKWLLKSLDGAVCLSNWQKQYLEKECPFLKGRVYFISLGVDVEYYSAIKNIVRESYILSVGRDNGRDYETVMRVAQKLPNQKFEIVCSKRNLSAVGEILKNVSVFYDLGMKELKKKYESAKFMLLATHGDKWSDGSDCSGQTVLLDAMASGLPVITTQKSYLADYASDSKEIIIVRPYDLADIIEKIKLMDNNELRALISKNARSKVEKYFSTEKMAMNLADIFKRIQIEK